MKLHYRIFRAITRALSVDFFVFKAAARYRPVRVVMNKLTQFRISLITSQLLQSLHEM